MITFLEIGNHGRIGNTLFQAGCTIALAKRNNDSFIFPRWVYEPFFPALKANFTDKKKILIRHTYQEPHFAYKEIPYKQHMNIHGYFQSEKYFNDFREDIVELLMPTHPDLSSSVPIRTGISSIHVRRTDYLVHKGCYTILTPENYYNKAIEMMKEIGVKKFFVFSDDIQWCRKVFHGDEFYFHYNHPIIDLLILSGCQHHIIGNSSFSWWGAYLSRSEDKKVIAPQSWFGPKLAPTHPTDDLIPDAWERV